MKAFVFLFPIKQYNEGFDLPLELLFSLGRQDPHLVMAQCIDKRYRENGYQVYYVNFPDTEVYGVEQKEGDRVITTDVTFEKVARSAEENPDAETKWIYPDFEKVLDEIGLVEELVVAGFHSNDCVRKLADAALSRGIDTLIDIDLTEMFFLLYYQQDYFRVEEYDPHRFEVFTISSWRVQREKDPKAKFLAIYDSPAFGFGPYRKPRQNNGEEDFLYWRKLK